MENKPGLMQIGVYKFIFVVGVLCAGQMMFICSLFIDHYYGTSIFGDALPRKLLFSLVAGLVWAAIMWIIFSKRNDGAKGSVHHP